MSEMQRYAGKPGLVIAMDGPADGVQAALAAIAVELVTSRWSDRMQVTLVGLPS